MHDRFPLLRATPNLVVRGVERKRAPNADGVSVEFKALHIYSEGSKKSPRCEGLFKGELGVDVKELMEGAVC